jgi:hypothetical protein
MKVLCFLKATYYVIKKQIKVTPQDSVLFSKLIWDFASVFLK